MENNPFFPYKNLGNVGPAESSECGSTTGPLEDSESLRKWKKMKQNGFLSSSHGGIPPVPKQRGRPPKKRRGDEQKREAGTEKGEQAIRFTQIASPSGLLSGLNPGIINHVRNSKQVHSIIEAIVGSATTDGQNHKEAGSGDEEVKDRKTDRFDLSSNRLFSFSVPGCHDVLRSELDLVEERFYSGPVSSQLASRSEDDNLTLELSSAQTMASENAGSLSNGDVSVSQDSVASLSLEAASVAHQWLDLLYKDTIGRLRALRRSRKRVGRAIHKELPYLLSTEASSNQENNTCFQQSSGTVVPNYVTPIDHVERWKSLFNQMEMALSEEGKRLEILLEQVKEMQMKCDKGLKSANDEALPLTGSSHLTRLKQKETSEGKYAVRAAAASLYSTCNMIMTAEDVSCF